MGEAGRRESEKKKKKAKDLFSTFFFRLKLSHRLPLTSSSKLEQVRPVPGTEAECRPQVALEVVVELDRPVHGLLRRHKLRRDGLLVGLGRGVGLGEKGLALAARRRTLLGLLLGGLEGGVLELGRVDLRDVDGRRGVYS